MDELLIYLKSSIADEFFSKDEKKTFRALVQENSLDDKQLNFLRTTIFELASEKINPNNYPFVLEWVKTATNALVAPPPATDACFSPGDACRNAIINHIDSAKANLNICVFTISDDQITKSLLAAHKKGIAIKVITDNDKSMDAGSDVDQLARAGVRVKVDTTTNHMHHKFMLADQRTLITGSYNWTVSAARYNQENILISREAGVIKSFAQQFDRLWQEMKEF